MNNVITKNGLILAGFALCVTMIVAITHQGTKEKIAEQEQKQLLKILDQVIDSTSYNNALYKHCVPVLSEQFLGSKEEQRAFVALHNEQPVAIAIETIAPNGYNGNIDLVVGINYQGVVTGVRTLSHQETPGLGDKIEIKKAPWITTFNSKFITKHDDEQWQVKKDGGQFDQFTGATITPRAVVQAVKNTLVYFKRNKETLFMSTARCGESK
ncbi:electron transport complex subunit RsxG [Psychrobium sp. 1_MG-2023]|nr:electron transport complex subunit RsxG [Psychrobium sp. 1_MG-2023]MDP2562901.1 electron transport complex subunit RsxG [Psychrobium sp. 1_MG-2023]PKF54040.1 electron transport complex subunit RsxG [Alteromonadales bacterium alter-6D02]